MFNSPKSPRLTAPFALIGLLKSLKAITWLLVFLIWQAPAMAATDPASKVAFIGLGREATPLEVEKWDIDVRPDFQGLPKGRGSVAQGQEVWESKCASCHGIFGESNQVFSPLIGGTTAEDIKNGRVANLSRTDYPSRTTIMKVATLSTLWDYINRAMPWAAPKSLSVNEVYAVLAYLLNLAYIVPENFELSDTNMAEVQKILPNRNGMTTDHALWPGNEFGGTQKPDTDNVICMKNCAVEPKYESLLPDYARNAHGNLAEQNRRFGQQVGTDTSMPEKKSIDEQRPQSSQSKAKAVTKIASTQTISAKSSTDFKVIEKLLEKNNCLACHTVKRKLVGPSFVDIAKKYPQKEAYIANKIKTGSVNVWGAIPMPAQNLVLEDILAISQWIASGAKQ